MSSKISHVISHFCENVSSCFKCSPHSKKEVLMKVCISAMEVISAHCWRQKVWNAFDLTVFGVCEVTMHSALAEKTRDALYYSETYSCLSRDVVVRPQENRQFWALRFGSYVLGYILSNLAYFRTCGKVWLISDRRLSMTQRSKNEPEQNIAVFNATIFAPRMHSPFSENFREFFCLKMVYSRVFLCIVTCDRRC